MFNRYFLFIFFISNGAHSMGPLVVAKLYKEFWSNMLFTACNENNYSLAKLALIAGAEHNKIHEYFAYPICRKSSPLTSAIQVYKRNIHWNKQQEAQRAEDIIQLLLKYQCSFNITDHNGRTALHNLLNDQTHHNHLIQQLLPQSDVTIKDNWDGTMLHTAIKNNHSIATIKALIEKGADSLAQSKYEGTPLHGALEQVHFCAELIALLISPDMDPAAKDSYGKTIFHTMAENHPAELNYLISIIPINALIAAAPSDSNATPFDKKNRVVPKKNSLKNILLCYCLEHYSKIKEHVKILPIDLQEELISLSTSINDYAQAIKGLKCLLSTKSKDWNWNKQYPCQLCNKEEDFKKFHPDNVEENFGCIIKRRIKKEFYRTKN